MKIPVFGYIYKVNSKLEGWAGWRLAWWWVGLYYSKGCGDGDALADICDRSCVGWVWHGSVDTPLGLPSRNL